MATFHMRRRWPSACVLLAAALTVMPAAAALAQNAVPNPLRGKPTQERAATQEKSPETKAEGAARPESGAKSKRERSAKQKENDEIMRACGATWRAEKAALQAKGETWRNYLKECRAKRRSEQKA